MTSSSYFFTQEWSILTFDHLFMNIHFSKVFRSFKYGNIHRITTLLHKIINWYWYKFHFNVIQKSAFRCFLPPPEEFFQFHPFENSNTIHNYYLFEIFRKQLSCSWKIVLLKYSKNILQITTYSNSMKSS